MNNYHAYPESRSVVNHSTVTMRARNAAKFSRTRKKDIIRGNESKGLLNEELEEANKEPTAEFVSQSSPQIGNSDSEEPEEDPEEQPEEDPEEYLEEDPEVELEEDPEEDSDEDPEEDPEEQLEEDPEVEPEEDPEEEPSEEPEEESAVECFSSSLSCHNNDETEQLIEDPSDEYVSDSSSESDTGGTDHNCSIGRKSSLDATAFQSSPLQVSQSQKKCRYEEAFKSESDVGSTVTDLQSESGVSEAVVNDKSASVKQEHVGRFGKRRRSRWEPQTEQDGETVEGNGNSKRRKSRWDSDASPMTMLGSIQLPDFMKDFIGSKLDPEIERLNSKLSEINNKLQKSELHDDRPEGERSPSPEPVYNNLGIRINTREVRFREKLVRERQLIISKLNKNPTFATPPEYKPAKFCKKLYIPLKEYPTYNFVGLILGPRGNTQKRMQKETGAKIQLRGKGSMKAPEKPDPSDNEDLHVCIEAANQQSLDAAVAMVEELLIPREEGMNDHKRAQLQELAKLNGTYNLCSVCKEQGHKHYACPQRQSTLKAISCDTCGSISHPTFRCSLNASPQVNNPLGSTSGLNFGSTPNVQNKPKKEISDANLYVGYLSQTVDDNRLRELFTPFGKITEAKVIKDRTTGVSRGYGFVKFEDPVNAAAAVTHMNGYQMDGKMLAVRVAGHPPITGTTASSHLPMYPGPPAVPPNVPSQATWLGPPASMLPEASSHLPMYPGPPAVPPSVPSQATWLGPPASMLPAAPVPFSNTEGLGKPSAFVYSGSGNHLPQFGDSAFPPSSAVSSLNESKSTLSSPGLLAQFPGDPDYPGSEFQSYFATSRVEPSPLFYFSQTPESDLKQISWETSQLPR